MSKTDEITKHYTVVGRANSSAAFEIGENIVLPSNFGGRRVQIAFTSRLVMHKGEQTATDLFFECQGSSDSLREAAEFFLNRADAVAGIVSVSANAYIENVNCELAYETTEDISEREFFQCLLPEKATLFPTKHKINKNCTLELIRAIANHKDADRILRAVSHYRDMLSHWQLEERLRCVAAAAAGARQADPR